MSWDRAILPIWRIQGLPPQRTRTVTEEGVTLRFAILDGSSHLLAPDKRNRKPRSAWAADIIMALDELMHRVPGRGACAHVMR